MWRCICGEEHEDQFDACWSCGRERAPKTQGQPPPETDFPPDVAGMSQEGEVVGISQEELDELDTPGWVTSGRPVTLKDEAILDEWSMMVDGAGQHANEVMDEIQRRLEEAQIPGGSRWALKEVKSHGWLSRVRREFLIIRLEQFHDYRMYVAVRAYGIHLDVCRFLTAEPGRIKGYLSDKLVGDKRALSVPKNILIEQDLRAWVTVVHHAVRASVATIMEKLGQDTSQIRRESKGYLEVW